MSATLETRVYRGGSLEELLPRIREELGPDAIITYQREGIIGGIGGFFGRRCVEVEVQGVPAPAAPPRAVEEERRPYLPPLPTRAVIDLYDSGEPWSSAETDPWPGAEGGEPAGEEGEDEPESPLIRTVLDQASPFAVELASVLTRGPAPEAAAPPASPAPPVRTAAPAESPALEAAPAFAPLAPAPALSVPAVPRGTDLGATGLPIALAAELVRDVEAHAVPFAPAEPLSELVRAELARRIRVRHGWRTKRRTIALVGGPGCGKTLAAAKLCSAYARSGRSVAALSLEPVRNALPLAALTDGLPVTLEVAECADSVTLAAARLRDAGVVVVDTPALAIGSPTATAQLGRLLSALGPDEIHLVLPAGDAGGEPLLETARASGIAVDRLLVTFAGEGAPAGEVVGLSLAAKLPISYIGCGSSVDSGLRPADPYTLATLVIS